MHYPTINASLRCYSSATSRSRFSSWVKKIRPALEKDLGVLYQRDILRHPPAQPDIYLTEAYSFGNRPMHIHIHIHLTLTAVCQRHMTATVGACVHCFYLWHGVGCSRWD